MSIPMKDPCVTYSGNTVDGGVMDQYIGESKLIVPLLNKSLPKFLENQSRDPWDERMVCTHKIK